MQVSRGSRDDQFSVAVLGKLVISKIKIYVINAHKINPTPTDHKYKTINTAKVKNYCTGEAKPNQQPTAEMGVTRYMRGQGSV